jgi:ribosomal protein S3
MGQKVHPLGFRVGITKKHQSQWFARFNKHKYSQSILEDRMIRDKLSQLFPELLNPALNSLGSKKREEDIAVTPRITQIKIERGLIPYEIGIQIHAENCELLKSAIDNLKVKRELIQRVEKTRRYLLSLKLKLKDLTNNNNTELKGNGETSTQSALTPSTSKIKVLKAKTQSKGLNNKKKIGTKKVFKFRPKLTKQELRRQRLIKKRLRKRQFIRRRYRQLILKGLFIKKTGKKIIQTLSFRFVKKLRKRVNPTQQKSTSTNSRGVRNTFSSRIKKKFVTLFIQKMNKKFLAHLKVLLMNYNSQLSNSDVLPLGYSKKWSFNHRLATLKNQPIYKLNRLVVVLEQKLLVKLESLRKEFIAFGSISARSAESFGYFQILTFLKKLKELVNKLKREQKLSALSAESKQSLSKNNNSAYLVGPIGLGALPQTINNKLKVRQSTTLSLAETVLQKKLNNIEDECRKIKFIEYLKDLVKKHRTENIYFYLATLADAKKDLKKIKQFTKNHANFLFGLNLKNSNSADIFKEKINERVSKVLEKTAKKADFEKTLQDIFLEQIEKQRNMCLQNLQLTPKISIKFYSVNKKTLEQKASVVSESVVDALEKRKAFRKVIKDAKEALMRTPGVKGVKIQVAGRLNGAEIARTEWVKKGKVPLQNLRANLDYSYKTAATIYGIIGVKVWIFKGYVVK